MRHFVSVLFLAATTACAASSGDGVIPITTGSAAARDLFLMGRAANEDLLVHDAHEYFTRAAAADSTFALAEYGIALTAPNVREQAEHLGRAIALSAHASPGERLMILGMRARLDANPARVLVLTDSLVRQYPRDARARWLHANAFSTQQHYDSAIAEYQRAIALDPAFSLAYNQVGYAYRSAGRLDSAEHAFQRYIALVPNNPNPYDSYAELLMKMGRFDESIAQYRKALAIDPHFGGSYVGIAADHMYAGRYPEAKAEARVYLDSARDDSERRTALLTLALVQLDAGTPDSALATLRRRAELAAAAGDTVNLSADYGLIGDVSLGEGNTGAARDAYRHAHDLIGRSGLPADVKEEGELAFHPVMARLALAQHDVATARTQAGNYLTHATYRHNAVRVREAHEVQARVLLASNDWDGALAELAQADRDDPAVLWLGAKAYEGKGDAARARQLSVQAAQLNILPTLPYILTRRAVAGATRLARSGSARETPR